MLKRYLMYWICSLLFLTPTVMAQAWKSSTPGAGGWYEAVGVGSDGVLLIGSDLSGAYISKNNGQTWDIIGATKGVKATHISAVGFHNTDANILLLGSDSGIFRSTNKGVSFSHVLPAASYITTIQSAPSSSAILYAAGHSTYNKADAYIYMSTNSGATWIKQASGLSKIRIQKLVVHPTKANELYAVSAPDRFVPKSAVNQKIYKSVNSGKTWQEFAPALKKTVFDFGLVKANPNEMYLSTDVGVLYSANAGVSWSNTGLPPEYDYYGKNVGYSLWLPTTANGQVKVISNALTVWGTKNGVWLANKSGAKFTWKSTTPVTNSIGAKSTWETPDYWHYAERGVADLLTGFYHNGESLRTMATDPRNANRIVMVNDQWALQSNDNGKSFNNLFTKPVGTAWASRGLENVNVYTVAASRWTANNILFAGYADIGCWRSLNSGTSWESCQAPEKGWDGDYGGNTSTISIDPSRQGVVWAAMGKSVEGAMSLMRSNQSGKFDSWSTSMNGIPNADATLMFGLSVDRNSPVNQRTLFVTANGNVYRSQDDGKNWKKVLDCRSRTQQQNGVQAYCTSTAVDYFNRNLVYAAGSAGVFTSQDGGNTWNLTNSARMTTAVSLAALFNPHGAGRYFVSNIVADPLTPNQVYIAVFDQKNATNLGGIWMGTKGSNWSRLYKNPYLRHIVASPYKKGELLALSSHAYTDGGYSSQSAGVLQFNPVSKTWDVLNQGLAFNNLSAVAYTANVGRIVIGTMGQGLMKNW